MPIDIQTLVTANLLTGFTGSAGSQGVTGFTGSQGNIGFTGSQGDIGYTGSLGYTGSIGYTGSQGDIGFTGSQGAIGFTGSLGYTGSIGFTGSQGPTTIAASALTGTTLASGVTSSSLTSVGTLSSLTVSGNVTVDTNTLFVDATNDRVGIGTTSPTSRLHISGITTFDASMLEKATVSATAASGTIAFDAITQGVLLYTSNSSGNWTLNVRGNSGTSLNTLMTTGQSLTIAFLATNGSSAFYQTGFQIDGTSTTIKWIDATAPSSGNANSIEVYSYTIVKTANATFTVLGSRSRFA